MEPFFPVILSGGIGSRLWPLSREAHPKPFIQLDDGESLIEKTYKRAQALGGFSTIITVTSKELLFHTQDNYSKSPHKTIEDAYLLEPFGRNSAAAIAAGALHCLKIGGAESILLVMPSDHIIHDLTAFKEAVEEAKVFAAEGRLVTFGIQPDHPNTGFGYIEAAGSDVKRFVEKPDFKTAQSYLEKGNFYWNSGMFCMKASVFLAELSQHCPDVAQQVEACYQHSVETSPEPRQIELDPTLWEKVRDISVDYAVFEKSQNVSVVACDIGWSDIGSWVEFGGLHPIDENGNNISGLTVLNNVRNTVVHGESDRLIAAVDVENLIIADTSDALLIANKTRAQDVRKIAENLKQSRDVRYKEFPTCYRPWGSYTVLQEGAGYKVKRIEVKPGAQLSLQSHEHRSEHWVVVQGVGHIKNGDIELVLNPNESTYIPVGNIHRLSNKGTTLLIMIEVQCGGYLGEDDIVRYEDIYGRG